MTKKVQKICRLDIGHVIGCHLRVCNVGINQKRRALLTTGHVLAVAMVMVWPQLVRAQDSGSAVQLGTITVQGEGQENPKGPVKGYVAKSSSTATKTGTPILETPQSVSVITRDQIDAQDAKTLSEALQYTPGVVAAPYGSDARFDSPTIRGFDGRQVQFLNGLRIMRTAGAAPIELYGLERVEVLRGPASILYGQANPGGLINQISKRPTFDAFGEVGVQIGSDDYYQTMFDLGGPIADSENFAYRLTGVARNAHDESGFLDNDRYFVAPAFTWKPDDDTSLTVLTSFQRDNPSSPSGLPPALTLNATGVMLPRGFYVGDPSFDFSNRKQTDIGYEFEHRFDETWTFRQNFRYSNLDWNYQSLGMSSAGNGMAGSLIARNATFQDERLNTFNVDNNLQAEFATGGIDHKLVFGLDYRNFDNKVKTEFWRATPLDPVSPVYGGPISLISRSTYADVKSTLTQLGIYAQDEMSYDNWRATVGLRYDWASTEGGAISAPGTAPRSRSKDDEKPTGRVGLGYVFDNGIAPYVSYATSFEPTPVPANGKLLEPTMGEQWEAGIKYQPQGWDGFFSAAVYDLLQKNVSYQISSTPLVYGQYDVRVKGLELEGVTSLADGLNLRAAYTYMDTEIVSGTNNGRRYENAPRHSAGLWLDYTFAEDTPLEGFGMGGGVRYVGQRYGNSTNTFDMSAVTLFDAGVHYDKNNYRASLNVQNIADKEYLASCGTFGCYYGNGRTVMGKLTYRW